MVVRIRFQRGPNVARKGEKKRRLALAVGALLPPAAFCAALLGLWRIAADLNWTGSFAISTGVFSHAQVWLVGAGMLQLCARSLNRYGKRSDVTPVVAPQARSRASSNSPF
jgi:hypothetical protein